MNKDYWTIAALAAISLLILTVFGRRHMIRESLFAHAVFQAISWPITIFLVYWGKIESPIRLFPKATDSNFLFSFVFFPSVFVAYYLHYPRQKCHILQIVYTLAVTGGIALLHATIQAHTNLLKYISFSGYTLWLICILSFYISRIYIDWYFSQLAKEGTADSQ